MNKKNEIKSIFFPTIFLFFFPQLCKCGTEFLLHPVDWSLFENNVICKRNFREQFDNNRTP